MPALEAADVVWITQLLAQYGHVVDAAQWDRFDELFLPDADLDYTAAGAPRVFHGIAEITEFFRTTNHPSAHHCVNVHVAARGEAVEVHSKFFVPYTRPSHETRRWKGGDYLDVVERTPDGWRFRSRTCVATWQSAGPPEPALERHRSF